MKYYGALKLDTFSCEGYTRSSFINRICYDAPKQFMVILLKETWYPYCGIDAGTVEGLKKAESMGRFFNSNVKSKFDCRVTPAPKYGQ